LLALGGATLLLAALWLARPTPAREPTGATPDVAAAPAAEPVVPPSVRRRTPVGETPFADLPEIVRRFLESTPYPPGSGRLDPGQLDLLEPNRRFERHRPIPDTLSDDPNAVVTWLFTTDRWSYVGPEAVHVLLEVRRGGEPVPIEVVAATATREDGSGLVGAPQALGFELDGDRHVADLSLAPFADHFGPIELAVRFEYAEDREHEDRIRIFSTPADHVPGAVTAASDRVTDGSLYVDVAADLRSGGFYRFDANLYGPNGEPVAFLSWKGELAAGAQTIPLEVWGKLLRDAGVPGPYQVGEIRGYRFLDGQYPDREMLPPFPARYTTKAWPLDAFSDAAHVSEHELHMAELMLDDLEQGRELLAPPAAGDPVASRAADDDAEVRLPAQEDP
jgi:hypothetical protein